MPPALEHVYGKQAHKRQLTWTVYATPLMTPTTALGLSIRLSMFELRETGDWDIFLGPPERARAESGGADQWVLKRRELPGFAIVNEKKCPHPWDTHHQFSIKTLCPTQSIMYVPLQVNRFKKIILLIVQYKYLKSCSRRFYCPNLILRTRLCGTMFITQPSCLFYFRLTESVRQK